VEHGSGGREVVAFGVRLGTMKQSLAAQQGGVILGPVGFQEQGDVAGSVLVVLTNGFLAASQAVGRLGIKITVGITPARMTEVGGGAGKQADGYGYRNKDAR